MDKHRQKNNINVYIDEWVNDIGDGVEPRVEDTPETWGRELVHSND